MQINTVKLVGGEKARAKDVNDNVDILKSAIYQLETDLNEYKSVLTDLKRKPTREIFDIYFSIDGEAPAGAFPLWTGQTINNCRSLFPAFWNSLKKKTMAKTIPSLTTAEYEEKLEEYGQCGAFVVDELNGHVRLPKINHFISSISELSENGTVHKDAQQKV